MKLKSALIMAIPLGLITGLVVVYFTHITPLPWGFYQPLNDTGGLMLNGYDTVAQLQHNKPLKGSEKFTTDWRGASWQFSTAQNKILFVANPEKYAPQFGGNCAKAVSSNMTAKGDPNIYYIHDNKLYVFFNQHAKDLWVSKLDKDIVNISHQNWAEAQKVTE